MLDTNISSFIIRKASEPLKRHLEKTPLADLSVSVLTEAELRFGVAKTAHATNLARLVENFLSHVAILPWTSEAAAEYALLRCDLAAKGLSLTNMDMLIAAHARAAGAVLVTNDAALLKLAPIMKVVDWTRDS
ncbi:PIN domain-containing protein [Methylocystis iwaonis]|uniref:PIN domain-containing protein n=1 Tax=Methylocystis iwaonis TaxID=2885079 RepID=UPI002E7B9A35|nr:PIN domain-containing protein [Methylocystis iwaonis]